MLRQRKPATCRLYEKQGPHIELAAHPFWLEEKLIVLGPHRFTMKIKDIEYPVDLRIELEDTLSQRSDSGLDERWGSLICEGPITAKRLRIAMLGDIALVASLMRVAAASLRTEAELHDAELYRFSPGDLSDDWSFYTFGGEDDRRNQ